jgi:hypothetical protein
LKLQPDLAEAHWNQSLLMLLTGDFERGWPEYEWRLKTKQHHQCNLLQPLWGGQQLAGRTILLHAEQGMGDTLQFIRYTSLVKQRGGKVIVSCQKPLLPILKSCQGIDGLLPQGSAAPPCDFEAHLMSLPAIFGTTLATIPAEVPYLSAKPELVEHWREMLRPLAGFKVGINWRGTPGNPYERYRGIPLGEFAPLARLPGVSIISLQKGPGWEEIGSVSEEGPVVDLGRTVDEEAGPFMDTAAIMRNLDLVITSDTVISHLAGALDVPVWLALPFVPDWRWVLEREDSPWYPRHRLFRQARPGDWSEVFERIATALQVLAAARTGG